MVKYEWVYISWVDSYGVEGEWQEIDDVLAPFSRMPIIRSAGQIVREDDEAVTLAAHVTANLTQVCGLMTIPKCSIIRRQRLELVEDEGASAS